MGAFDAGAFSDAAFAPTAFDFGGAPPAPIRPIRITPRFTTGPTITPLFTTGPTITPRWGPDA